MNFKLALAAAAVVGLAGTAQAADLAKKAPAAADYVKVCDAYGAGFFYIPGSDTCLKIGGYVRVELRTGDHSGSLPAWAIGHGYGFGENALNSRVRTQLTFDARTNTEMGLLRSFIELWVTNHSGSTGTNAVNMRNAFIQFAGLTAGRASSNFDFIQGGYNIGNIEPDGSDRRVNLLAYTFSFGNGISATLGVEDQTTGDQALGWAAGPNTNVKLPNIVGNVAVAQAWGRAQLSFALNQNRVQTPDNPATLLVNEYVNENKMGYAIGAGVEVNLPMLGAGDKMFVQGVYTNGATHYALNNTSGVAPVSWDPTVLGNPTSKAWVIAGGLNHNFSKQVEANLGVSYLDYNDASAAAFDYTSWVVGGDIRWKPVAGLTIAAALDYRNVNYSVASGLTDGSQWLGTLRVQRNF